MRLSVLPQQLKVYSRINAGRVISLSLHLYHIRYVHLMTVVTLDSLHAHIYNMHSRRCQPCVVHTRKAEIRSTKSIRSQMNPYGYLHSLVCHTCSKVACHINWNILIGSCETSVQMTARG